MWFHVVFVHFLFSLASLHPPFPPFNPLLAHRREEEEEDDEGEEEEDGEEEEADDQSHPVSDSSSQGTHRYFRPTSVTVSPSLLTQYLPSFLFHLDYFHSLWTPALLYFVILVRFQL